jgi:hypothetical protein
MELPFFLTKLFSLFKRKKKPERKFETYVPPPNYRSGYVKSYPDGMWHTADNLDAFQFERYKRQHAERQLSRYGTAEERMYHQRVCSRYHQVETLDGSEYYLCQHGVHIT